MAKIKNEPSEKEFLAHNSIERNCSKIRFNAQRLKQG
jgi:hypothetical protein